MSKVEIPKLLVANRGEIAVRIFRACYDLGIHTVAMYSNEDANSLFRTKADEAYLVGEKKSPLGAYLDIPGIIGLAKRRGVKAIHPGYGFLSENAEFARACEENGLRFVGPSSEVLEKMGDKLSAKAIAIDCGVPIIPGCTEPLTGGEEAVEMANRFGYPVILKAAAGGGGRGMRRCDTDEEVRNVNRRKEITSQINRLVGDNQPGAPERICTTPGVESIYPADYPLKESGLIGPVRLLESK